MYFWNRTSCMRWKINYEMPISYVGNIVCKLEVTKCCDRMKRDIWSSGRRLFEDNRLQFAAPCNMENTCRRFRWTWSSLMEGEGFSEESLHIYDTTQHHIPEDTYHALFTFSSVFGYLVSRIFVSTSWNIQQGILFLGTKISSFFFLRFEYCSCVRMFEAVCN